MSVCVCACSISLILLPEETKQYLVWDKEGEEESVDQITTQLFEAADGGHDEPGDSGKKKDKKGKHEKKRGRSEKKRGKKSKRKSKKARKSSSSSSSRPSSSSMSRSSSESDKSSSEASPYIYGYATRSSSYLTTCPC